MAEVNLLVVPEAHVAAVGADSGGGVGHEGGHLLHVFGVHLVVVGADGEGADLDLVQAVPALPVLEVTGDDKLALALHLVVDLLVGEAEGPGEGLRPRLDAADHLGIEILHHDLVVLGIVVVLLGFEDIEAREGCGRELLLDAGGALEVGPCAGGHVRND